MSNLQELKYRLTLTNLICCIPHLLLIMTVTGVDTGKCPIIILIYHYCLDITKSSFDINEKYFRAIPVLH